MLFACPSEKAEPRPQLLVYIDTDAHVLGSLAERGDVSPDAAIDTVRIEAFDADGSLLDSRTFAAADPLAWPLSFGIAGPGAEVRLRVRAFRRYFSDVFMDDEGVAQYEPPYQITIDRLAFVARPEAGIKRVLVHLAADCLGQPVSFGDSPGTCIDAVSSTAQDPAQHISVLREEPVESRIGTWPLALEHDCTAQAKPGRVCIPGGFALLGNVNVVGFDAEQEALPYRPVVLSPFFLDEFEFTVGRLRELLKSGADVGALPFTGDGCTWHGEDDAAYDDYPLNCMWHDTAAQICKLLGGHIPSEAQWEFAATGRGRRQLYPWGDQAPGCCISAGRDGSIAAPECPGSGVEPVGSHMHDEGCEFGDISRDGVVDMGGSLKELVRDELEPYDAACWRGGVLHDPVCASDEPDEKAARGTYFTAAPGTALSSLRHSYVRSPADGFRCAYEDG